MTGRHPFWMISPWLASAAALERAEQTSRLLAGTRLGEEGEDLLRAIMSVDLTNTQGFELDSPLPETDR